MKIYPHYDILHFFLRILFHHIITDNLNFFCKLLFMPIIHLLIGYVYRFKTKFASTFCNYNVNPMFNMLVGNIISTIYGSFQIFVSIFTWTLSLLFSPWWFFKRIWSQLPYPHCFFPGITLNSCLLSSRRFNSTHPHSRGITCWSSGVHMPHVIWLSKLISDDQCLCPLTEPTRTNPSRYEMSAWVPSWLQVKSLTFEKHTNRSGQCVILKEKHFYQRLDIIINLAFG